MVTTSQISGSDTGLIGVLLVMHAPLGNAFAEALAHIYRGPPAQFDVIDVVADQPTSEVGALVNAALARLDTGSGVLVVTDLVGGTPANCAHALQAGAPKVAVVAGASLPMLLRALTYRQGTLAAMCEAALKGGQGGAVQMDTHGPV